MRILFGVKGRTGDADHSVLIRQLHCESVVLGPLLPLTVHQVFLHDLHPGNVRQHEIPSLRHPQVYIVFALAQLLQQQVSVVLQCFGVLLHVGVLRTTNHLQTFGKSVLQHVVTTEHSVLVDGAHRLDEVGRTDHPPAPHPRRCKNLPRRVHRKSPLEKPFLEGHFRQILIVHVIEGHAFVNVVLDYDNLGVLPEDLCHSGQFRMAKHFPHRVVGRVQKKNLGLRAEGLLERIEIDIPFVLFLASQALLQPG